jgi:hypothetical protein
MGARDFRPRHQTTSSIRLLFSLPKETPQNFFHRFDEPFGNVNLNLNLNCEFVTRDPN